MVVNDVEHDPEPAPVAGGDKALKAFGAAIPTVRRPQVRTVVPPSACPAAFSHGHHLDDRDAQVDQVVQVVDGAVERALRAEGADVHLVDDGGGQVETGPPAVIPREPALVHDGRGRVHSVGLPRRPGVGAARPAVEREGISCPWLGFLRHETPPAELACLHGEAG